MRQKVKEIEIGNLVTAISQLMPNYNPKILYIFVDKNSGVRMLEQYEQGGNLIVNPGPGTVVHQGIV